MYQRASAGTSSTHLLLVALNPGVSRPLSLSWQLKFSLAFACRKHSHYLVRPFALAQDAPHPTSRTLLSTHSHFATEARIHLGKSTIITLQLQVCSARYVVSDPASTTLSSFPPFYLARHWHRPPRTTGQRTQVFSGCPNHTHSPVVVSSLDRVIFPSRPLETFISEPPPSLPHTNRASLRQAPLGVRPTGPAVLTWWSKNLGSFPSDPLRTQQSSSHKTSSANPLPSFISLIEKHPFLLFYLPSRSHSKLFRMAKRRKNKQKPRQGHRPANEVPASVVAQTIPLSSAPASQTQRGVAIGSEIGISRSTVVMNSFLRGPDTRKWKERSRADGPSMNRQVLPFPVGFKRWDEDEKRSAVIFPDNGAPYDNQAELGESWTSEKGREVYDPPGPSPPTSSVSIPSFWLCANQHGRRRPWSTRIFQRSTSRPRR